MKHKTTYSLLDILFRIAYWLIFISSIFVKCLYVQHTTEINSLPFFGYVNNTMMLATMASIIIILGFIVLISNKKRYLVLFIADIILSLLLFSDTVYFRYYNSVITIPVLYQIGLVGDTIESVFALVKITDLLFFIDWLILFIFLFVFRKLKMHSKLNLKRTQKIAVAASLLVVGLLTTSYSYKKVDTSLFVYDNNHAIRRLGILYFHAYETSNHFEENVFVNRTLTAEETENLEDFFINNKNGDNPYMNSEKGKNLIIVQLEALQTFLLHTDIDGKEITPNLNKLADNSLYFNNLYYQIAGGNTSDAEFLCNNSLYAADKGAVYFRYPSNKYYSLPILLEEEGYNSYVFHANEASFWNRHAMYASIGFDKFYSDKDFIIDEALGWGLTDSSFYRQTVDKLNPQESFYAFLITLSSHHPYGAFEDYSFDVGKYEGTLFGNYMKAANYVDSTIGELIELLKEKGLYENTLLVLYGDHFGINHENSGQITSFLGKEDNTYEYMELQKVPLIIHSSDIKAKNVETTSGQIDIMPTILNLMGIEAQFCMGRDILGVDYGHAVLRNGTVITDKYIYVNSQDKLYDRVTGEILTTSEYVEEISRFQSHLDLSDLILRKNALKKLAY